MSLSLLLQKIQHGIHSQKLSAHNLIIIPTLSIPYKIDDIVKYADVKLYEISLPLAESLLPLSQNERQELLSEQLTQIITDIDAEIAYLSRIEFLFTPSLSINTLNLLKKAARIKPLVVFWPGLYHNAFLTYAEPGHPEYQSYSKEYLKDVFVITTDTSEFKK